MTFSKNDFKEGDDVLIDKFLKGELSPTEKNEFDERMKSSYFRKELSQAEIIAGSAKYIAMKEKLDMLKDLENSLGKNNQKSDS